MLGLPREDSTWPLNPLPPHPFVVLERLDAGRTGLGMISDRLREIGCARSA
jgi:hypothetical protein